ncbi:CD3324 family protein [Bacillus cereus]|uniref:CD3324 family protein n=1 Tax=Bacillus cereus TaxID=1396 RepID=UPI00356C8209
MKYVKAATVLPESLIVEIQKYVQGETIYIPKQETAHYKWGTQSGGRKQIDARNREIKDAFKNGTSIFQLAEEYFLSAETIKKIVYSKS